jgi:hypothetical protein
MRLTRLEKERLADSRLKIQSVTDSLKHVDPAKVDSIQEIQECLEAAEHTIRGALRSDTEPRS